MYLVDLNRDMNVSIFDVEYLSSRKQGIKNFSLGGTQKDLCFLIKTCDKSLNSFEIQLHIHVIDHNDREEPFFLFKQFHHPKINIQQQAPFLTGRRVSPNIFPIKKKMVLIKMRSQQTSPHYLFTLTVTREGVHGMRLIAQNVFIHGGLILNGDG